MRRLYPTPENAPIASPYSDLLMPDPPEGRPFVYVNMAMTLDGKVTSGNPKSGSLLTGSEADRRGMAELRSLADAVLIGAGTLRAENPVMEIRDEDLRRRRIEAGRPETPRYGVVTRSGALDAGARLFAKPGSLVVTTTTGARRLPERVRAETEIVEAGTQSLDLQSAVGQLRTELGIRHLLIEGGPTLTHAFLERSLVDELFLTLAPVVKAGIETPTLVEGAAFAYGALPRFRLVSVSESGGELFLRYAFDASS